MAASKKETFGPLVGQLDLAERYCGFGLEAMERMVTANMEGARLIIEVMGRQLTPVGTQALQYNPATIWFDACRKAVAAGAESSMVCFRTAAALQIEGSRLLQEFVPQFNRDLIEGLEEVSGAVHAAARPVVQHRRAA
jgi:hypothetical protein